MGLLGVEHWNDSIDSVWRSRAVWESGKNIYGHDLIGEWADMRETVIEIENLKKQYHLGTIGGGTLTHDLQSWWARKRGRQDPNTKIGEETKTYNSNSVFWALDGINLEVYKGEAVGIIGANGAGKSTMLKILSRVTAPTEGEIRIKGRIASMLEVGTGFHGELTGRENIYMNGAILGMTRKEVDSKIEEIIDFSECRQFIDTPVKRYSSGMYVKLAFAVAAHLDAEILVMDEVLAVGDMKFQKKCLGKMDSAANHEGKTVLYVSHNMNTIRQLCTRCIVLKEGQIIFDGDVEKAIRIYLENDDTDMRSVYDLTEVRRPSAFHGSLFHLDEFVFINKDEPVYFTNEKILYKIKWTAKAALEELRLSFTIQDADDRRTVGMAQSEVFANVKIGQQGESTLELDVSNLVEGRYCFQPDVYVQNEFGTYASYDHPLQRIYFQLMKDTDIYSMTWEKKYWGNVMLNTMKVI